MYNLDINCNEEINENFLRNCNHRPKSGILRKWVGFFSDIDQEASNIVKNVSGMQSDFHFDQFVLKQNASIYRVEGNDKIHKVKHEYTPGDFVDGYIHTDTITFLDRNQIVLMNLADMQDGRFFTISEMVDAGGDGRSKFLIAGAFSGMKMLTNTFDSGENSGTMTMELATKENEMEPHTLLPLLLTDGTTTPATLETTLSEIQAMEYTPV